MQVEINMGILRGIGYFIAILIIIVGIILFPYGIVLIIAASNNDVGLA